MGVVKAGICVHIVDEGAENPSHLYVILNDPDNGNPPGVAVVRLRSYREGLESTVILNPGEHPFIIRKTTVDYVRLKVVEVERLERRIKEDRQFRHKTDFSRELLERVKAGVFKSDFARPIMQEYCKKVFWPNPAKTPQRNS